MSDLGTIFITLGVVCIASYSLVSLGVNLEKRRVAAARRQAINDRRKFNQNYNKKVA